MSLLLVQLVLLLASMLLALLYGGAPERLVSSSFLSVLAVDQLAHFAGLVEKPLDVEIWHLLLDASLTGVVVYVALKADRLWPLPVASAQLVATIAGFLDVMGVGTQPLAWAILIRGPTWMAIVFTLLGIVNRRRALKHLS